MLVMAYWLWHISYGTAYLLKPETCGSPCQKHTLGTRGAVGLGDRGAEVGDIVGEDVGVNVGCSVGVQVVFLHDYMGHNYMGHNCIGHDYIGPTWAYKWSFCMRVSEGACIGHDCIGHIYNRP